MLAWPAGRTCTRRACTEWSRAAYAQRLIGLAPSAAVRWYPTSRQHWPAAHECPAQTFGKPLTAPPPRVGDSSAWDPTTSTLIFSARDAVLVDALMTVRERCASAGSLPSTSPAPRTAANACPQVTPQVANAVAGLKLLPAEVTSAWWCVHRLVRWPCPNRRSRLTSARSTPAAAA